MIPLSWNRPPTLLRRLLAVMVTLTLAAGLASVALAQEAGPVIAITGVDSQAFPTVTAKLTVTGANGLPLVGLTTSDLMLVEDGRPVPARDMVLDSDTSQPLTLVLAVDLAMPAEQLLAVQSALREFTDSLTPQDRVAVITFSDEVVAVQGFTSDRVALATAIGGMTSSGRATLFNQAADDAVILIRGLPPGRKAVLLFTDSGDTVNTLSPESTLENAQEAGVALYPFAIGTRVNATIINNWARFTGGQAFLLSTAAEVQPNLQTLAVLMRQSYRITYASGLAADDARHSLVVEVNAQGQSAKAESTFIAVPGEVTLAGLTIANGQTLRGMVFLIAEVTAPAPVESVIYSVDGDTLVELTSPPYRFDWDTATVGAGPHAVTVTARDTAGNTGTVQVSVNVAVPPPVVPTAAPVPTAVPKVSPVVGLARSALSIGQIVLSAAALLVVVVVALLLWLRSRELQAPKPVTGYLLELINRSNARAQFELRAEDPAKLMRFQFLVNDASLATRRAPVNYAPAAAAQVAPAGGLAAAPAAASNGKSNGKEKSRGRTKRLADQEQFRKTQGALFTFSAITTRLSSWVTAATYFLPSRMSSKVRSQTSTVRDIGWQAHEAGEAPERYERMAEAVVDVDKLKARAGGPPERGGKSKAPPAAATVVAPPPSAAATTMVSPAAMAAPASSQAAQPAALKQMRANVAGWAVTPMVEPGGKLTVRLTIMPSRVPKTQSYGFRVLSRVAEGTDPSKLTQIEHGSVALVSTPWYRQVVSWLLLVVMLAALAGLAWYLLGVFGVLGVG
jgi:VWFA-related protein